VSYRDLMGKVRAEPSAAIQTRVERARKIQARRFRRTQVFCNAQMGSRHIRAHCGVDPDSQRLLETAVDKLGLSARAYNRILKIARTLADLAGIEKIGTNQIAEAIQYRTMDRKSNR
jgi:magnesium chelatase family protein